MKQLYFVLIAISFSLSSLGNNSCEKYQINYRDIQDVIEAFRNNESIDNNTQVKHKLSKQNSVLSEINKSCLGQARLKSSSDKNLKLDSLLVERWNDNTGQMEPSQLEYWFWNEKGESESWELYNMDTLTNEWYPNDKEVYAWDENGNKTMHMDYDPDSLTGAWIKSSVGIYSYNNNDDILESLLQFWNNDLANWVNNIKITYEYNELEETAITQYLWNTSEEVWDTTDYIKMEFNTAGDIIFSEFYLTYTADYIIHMRDEYAYDSSGNKIQSISTGWDSTSKQFINLTKNSYEFDGNGKKKAWRQFSWSDVSNEWEEQWNINYQYDSAGFQIYRDRYNRIDSTGIFAPSWKNEYTNNNSGLLLQKTCYNWISGDSLWVEDYQRSYEYSSNGEISYEDYSEWDTTLNHWTNGYKKDNSFDTNGKIVHEDRYNWDSTLGEWLGEYQKNYDYDSNENYLGEENQVWDTTANNWANLYSYNFTYDLSVPFSEIEFPDDFAYAHLSNIAKQDQYTNKMMSKVYSEQKNGQLEITEKTSLFYSEMNITGITELAQTNMKVYPNPTSNYVVFDRKDESVAQVMIYDLQGKIKITKELKENNRVSLQQLETGIYLYQLTEGTKLYYGKLIKK